MDDFVDIYCERFGPGFWAEPLNALSNIAFFVAAYYAWRLAKRNHALDKGSGILVILLGVIGLGSFSFHTLATEAAQIADVIPILFYQVAFLLLYSKHVMKFTPRATRSLMFLFFLMIVAAHHVPEDVLNGSASYFPALFFLVRFAAWHRKNAPHEKNILLMASGLFILSLAFRSFDIQFCDQVPTGLHFLWHILNGTVLYLTARAFILNRKIMK